MNPGLNQTDKVVSIKKVNGYQLLKTETAEGKTNRYVCIPRDNPQYFRRISTSDRKRIGKNVYSSPWDKIQWKRIGPRWVGRVGEMEILTEYMSSTKSPEESDGYWIDGELHTPNSLLLILSIGWG
jgi:hypothetical protein